MTVSGGWSRGGCSERGVMEGEDDKGKERKRLCMKVDEENETERRT